MQLLKTCGIRKKLENYNNIDMLGFNFIESSKRYITPEKAAEIDTPFSTLRVGVFGKPSPQPSPLGGEGVKWDIISKGDLVDIIMIAKKSKMNAIQIHGVCDFAYLKMYNYLVIQSVSIADIKFPPNPPLEGGLSEYIDFYIIDGANPGSGEEYDYSKINNLNLEKRFLVAGGVSEENVGKIFEEFKNNENFCGVDIASGVDNGENIFLEKVGRIVDGIKGINK